MKKFFLPKEKKVVIYIFCRGEVAQLVRACGSYPQSRGFKSLPRYFFMPQKFLRGRNGFDGDSEARVAGRGAVRPRKTHGKKLSADNNYEYAMAA